MVFSTLSCATPGPNTIILATYGANFGFKKTIPYSMGIIIGRMFLQIMVFFFWAVFGAQIRQFLQSVKALKLFNFLWVD